MTILCVLVPSLDEGDINPKVLQLISNEKIQVRKRGPGLKQDSRVGTETRVCFLQKHCVNAGFVGGRTLTCHALDSN